MGHRMVFVSLIVALAGSLAGQDKGAELSAREKLLKPVTLVSPYPKFYKNAPVDRTSLQYAVMEMGRQVGVPYNFRQSFKNTDPLCRRWIYPEIRNVPCHEAILSVLEPFDLNYDIVNGAIVLEGHGTCKSTPSTPSTPRPRIARQPNRETEKLKAENKKLKAAVDQLNDTVAGVQLSLLAAEEEKQGKGARKGKGGAVEFRELILNCTGYSGKKIGVLVRMAGAIKRAKGKMCIPVTAAQGDSVTVWLTVPRKIQRKVMRFLRIVGDAPFYVNIRVSNKVSKYAKYIGQTDVVIGEVVSVSKPD